MRGKVGGDKSQTAATYHRGVRAKFPEGYYEQLQRRFRRLLKTFPPAALRAGVVYDLYDRWKKECAAGRRVDLDALLSWCVEQAEGRAS